MALKRGDIVLLPFPFTDLTSVKVRPTVIVSADPQGADVVIAFISSIVPDALGTTELMLSNKDPRFAATGLKRSSVFKVGKLLTISALLVLRRLGHVPAELQKELDTRLKIALGLT